MESEVDKLDVDKLVAAPVDLSKLTDVVKNDVVKKTYMMVRSTILKIKYLILLTYLLLLLLLLLKIKYLITVNISLLQNLISYQQKILLQD